MSKEQTPIKLSRKSLKIIKKDFKDLNGNSLEFVNAGQLFSHIEAIELSQKALVDTASELLKDVKWDSRAMEMYLTVEDLEPLKAAMEPFNV